MFQDTLPDKNISGLVRQWASRLLRADCKSNQLPTEAQSSLAPLLVQHVAEMFPLKDYFSEHASNSPFKITFENFPSIHAGMGVASYGSVEYGGSRFPLSYTVRVKSPHNLERKVHFIMERWNLGDRSVPQEINDGVAARLVIGSTDRFQYTRPHSTEFSPKSAVLDKVKEFVGDTCQYQGTTEDIQLIRSYNQSLSDVANHLWAHASLHCLVNGNNVFDSVNALDPKLRDKVLPEHIQELALLFEIYRSIQSKPIGDMVRVSPFIMSPKPNGYSALHLMFRLDSGFIPVKRELQLRTGFQHVYSSHPELAGHKEYQDAKYQSPVSLGLIPDYLSQVSELISQRFSR